MRSISLIALFGLCSLASAEPEKMLPLPTPARPVGTTVSYLVAPAGRIPLHSRWPRLALLKVKIDLNWEDTKTRRTAHTGFHGTLSRQFVDFAADNMP